MEKIPMENVPTMEKSPEKAGNVNAFLDKAKEEVISMILEEGHGAPGKTPKFLMDEFLKTEDGVRIIEGYSDEFKKATSGMEISAEGIEDLRTNLVGIIVKGIEKMLAEQNK